MLNNSAEYFSRPLISLKKKFIRHGNTFTLDNIFFNSFKIIKIKSSFNPFFIFFEAIEKVRFSIILRIYARKQKRSVKKIIIPNLLNKWIRYKKTVFLLSKSIRFRKDFFLHHCIANEIIDIVLYRRSNLFFKKKEVYNFAHFNDHKSYRNFKI